VDTLVKLAITIVIVLACAHIGKRAPTLAGLIATMPLTGLLVLLWLYSENPENYELMTGYVKGALWGILPSILFFIVAYLCFRKQLSFPIVLLSSFGVWLIGAFFHQLLLK
jgi:uncharacterized membrane protein (GlpM family)